MGPMRKLLGVVGLMVVVVACSSESEGAAPGGCADISGNWEVTSTKTSGDCPESGDGTATMTVTKADGGQWRVSVPAVTGGCVGDLNPTTCRLVIANCDVTKNGQTIGSFSMDWTFSGATLSGSEIGRILPPAIAKACESSYSDTGKKL